MDLSNIGLTVNEQRTLETMLRLGKTSAMHISKEARVTYGRIYEVLGSLEEKGLVKVVPEKTKKFVPDPDALLRMIRRKKEHFANLETDLEDFNCRYKENFTEPVLIVKGQRNFKKFALNKKKAENYNYDVKLNFETYPEFIRDARIKKRKGIDVKTLGRLDKETEKRYKEWKRVTPNLKPIKNEGVALSIVDDKETMIVLAKSNIIMLIKDKPFAKFMRRLFLRYFRTQKE